jgi:hypothetical protein
MIRFWQFLSKVKERDNTKKLEAQMSFKHGKGGKGIKEPKQRRLEPKAEATKTGCSGLGFWMVSVFLNR